ncbi:stigma-specific STIG1-like protein 1 [Mangifera indica]|uniref:stigma-specific STIG1-like protein 1 n=1 Tax=Mangifera indica TaxID=29780 RepID=UPI001CF9407D|nr:stigma-specific STIG1-like protein 1 [Mangifera indica]
MKLLNSTLFFALISATLLTVNVAATVTNPDAYTEELSTSLRGVSRLLAQQNMTCDKFPRVCRQMKSSRGPDCCKRKCVNVKTDKLNCGMCGYKCKYTEICCKGQCVNASFDERNCGGCNEKCKKGEYCVYGMCNYA